MSFTVSCPSCSLELSVPESAIGQQGQCPTCKTVFTIEQPYAAPRAMSPSEPIHWSGAATAVTPGMIRFGDGMSNGFAVLHANLGTFVLITLVWGVLAFVIAILGNIPILGIVVALTNAFVIGPALQGGIYRAVLGQHDGHPAEVGQLFSQFSNWVDFLLLSLVQVAISLAAMIIPIVVLLIGGIPLLIAAINNQNFQPENWQIGLLVFGVALFIPVAIFLGMAFLWSIPALVDRRRGFWDAVQTSWSLTKGNPVGTFATMFVGGLITLVGVLLCCVGGLYSVPAMMCMVGATYRTAVPGAAPPPGMTVAGPSADGWTPPPPLSQQFPPGPPRMG